MATITTGRKVNAVDAALGWLVIDQHDDLPLPTSIVITKDHVELTVDSLADLEAWAEHMGVDATHELHADGTWTDRAEGSVTIRPTQLVRAIRINETVRVTVYRPATSTYTPLELVA